MVGLTFGYICYAFWGVLLLVLGRLVTLFRVKCYALPNKKGAIKKLSKKEINHHRCLGGVMITVAQGFRFRKLRMG